MLDCTVVSWAAWVLTALHSPYSCPINVSKIFEICVETDQPTYLSLDASLPKHKNRDFHLITLSKLSTSKFIKDGLLLHDYWIIWKIHKDIPILWTRGYLSQLTALIKAPAISTYSYSLTVILDHHVYVFKVQEQDYNEPSRMYVALTNLIRKGRVQKLY